MSYNYKKGAGCENPATSQRSDVMTSRQTKPVAAMAGSFSRKVPGPEKVGQDVAGEARMVPNKSGKADSKQTWKGPREGYTMKSAPAYEGSPGKLNDRSSGNSAKQSVKGKMGKNAPSESKSVAGKM